MHFYKSVREVIYESMNSFRQDSLVSIDPRRAAGEISTFALAVLLFTSCQS